LAVLITASYGYRKVRLTDVKAITLSKNKYTNGRRSAAIPQLTCTHGDACGNRDYEPEVVQCVNVGSDGIDVNWECKAELDSSVRFGRTDVSCEGYDYPDDPYILEGSCGLEYTLEYTELGRQKKYGSSHNNYQYSNHYQGSSSGGFFGTFITIAIIAFIGYQIFNCFFASPQGFPNDNNNRGGYGGGFPPGGNPPGDGYGPNNNFPGYPKTSYTGYAPTYVPPPAPAPGFWTGLGTGGLLGYLFSPRPNYGYGYGYRPSFGYRPTYNSGFSSGGSPSSFGGSSSRSSSGFGTTRRR